MKALLKIKITTPLALILIFAGCGQDNTVGTEPSIYTPYGSTYSTTSSAVPSGTSTTAYNTALSTYTCTRLPNVSYSITGTSTQSYSQTFFTPSGSLSTSLISGTPSAFYLGKTAQNDIIGVTVMDTGINITVSPCQQSHQYANFQLTGIVGPIKFSGSTSSCSTGALDVIYAPFGYSATNQYGNTTSGFTITFSTVCN